MDEIKDILSNTIESDLVEALLKHYRELKQKFFLGQYELSQLNSAKFVEVAFRILEYITKNNYTPFNRDININKLITHLENLPRNQYSYSIRVHIPRVLKVVYDIRSKRGVTHVGEINPNLMDATFVASACDWIMAELIRLYYVTDPNKAQKIINSILERKIPIVEEFEEDLKILDPNLSVANKILLTLYRKYPSYVSIDDLKKWIKTKSPNYIPTVLRRLDDAAKIHLKGKKSKITKKGIDYVENSLPKEI